MDMERKQHYGALVYDSRQSTLECKTFTDLSLARHYLSALLDKISEECRYTERASSYLCRLDGSFVSTAIIPTLFDYVVLCIDIENNSIFPLIRNGYMKPQKSFAISDFERHLTFGDMIYLYNYVAMDIEKTKIYAMVELSLA